MTLTEKELRKAATLVASMPRCKGLSQRLMRASLATDPIKVKRPRQPVTVSTVYDVYNIPCYNGNKLDGYLCIGFDVAIKWAQGYYEWLRSEGVEIDPVDVSSRGTLEGYYEYRRLADRASSHNVRTGHRCPSQLTPQLIGLEGKRVEVVDMDGQTRRFIVGKSTGWCPIHLEIANRASHGGGGADSRGYKSVRQV